MDRTDGEVTPAGGEFLLRGSDARAVFTPEQFTADDHLMARTAADFVRREVLPLAEQIDGGDHELMLRLMRSAGVLGLLGADIPAVYGGLGLGQRTSALIAEALNPQQSFALTHEAHCVIATLPILFFGNHDQKSRTLPKLATGEWIGSFALSEAGSGSDALSMQTRADLESDGRAYIVTGSKMWITNSAFADLFTVFAKVDGAVTVFLVERTFPGVSFGKEERKLGMHGTSTRRVLLDKVRVPVENVLEVGKGHYAAFCALNMGRFKLEAGAVGGLKYLLEECCRYAKQRKTFGRAIAERGMIRHKIAEMAARTFGLESMVYRLAGDLDRMFDPIDPSAADASVHYHRAAEEYAVECSIVKVVGSEAYSELADEAIQIHGGNGYSEEFPLARAWRDQRLLRIGEGANEIVRGIVVNTLLRRDKSGRLPVLDVGRGLLAQGAGAAPEHAGSSSDEERIAESAAQAKRVCLMALADLFDQCGGADGIADLQELGGAVADMACGAYGLESVSLRLSAWPPGEKRETAVLLAKVAAAGYDALVERSLRALIDNVPESKISIDYVRLTFDTTMLQLRRALADKALVRGGYPV